MSIIKNVVRVGVVGGLLVGAAVVIAGPSRVNAIAGQARGFVNQKIDNAIQDPVALRQQLRTLEQQYPKKIAQVRGELAELTTQLAAIVKERDIAERVIGLASVDYNELNGLIGLAQDARMDSPGAIIRVSFDNQQFPLDQAYTKAAELSSTVNAYRGRLASSDISIDLLSTQRDRLEGLLTELEEERTTFQSQIWQLDSEIEMIARNDKMLEIFEERERSIDRLGKTEASSLEHVMTRMARIRAEQEARFESLANGPRESYEQAAVRMLETEQAAKDVFEKSKTMNQNASTSTETIDITTDGVQVNDVNHREALRLVIGH